MGGRCKLEELEERGYETADIGAGLSPRPGETAAGLPEPDSPVHGGTFQDVGGKRKGEKCSSYDGDKVYLGVRVKMPVRDLLKKIRVTKAGKIKTYRRQATSQNSQGTPNRQVLRSRLYNSAYHFGSQRKGSTQSLEELAIIVEVLEEDLRTGSICHSSPPLIPQSYMSYSPLPMDYQQTLSPDGVMHTSLQPSSMGNFGRRGECVDPQNHDWNLNNSSYFLAQLKKEESQLMDVSNARALGYAIAKRMAAHNSLDLKDSDGMTALLHAAKHNQHLMVADLIQMSVIQCASVALKATVRQLNSSMTPSQSRLQMLRQEQMMETLECLLQMGA
ncbi:hypothetical protein F7725_020234 [Dissostichus mawsoni]|uniref:OCA domain-containing protein n=1 Tax=Dissostichus mawsoni TaxID=36200 RepID=A0A7J5YCL7_DISMA|nr:hypothetical protein F7725_020234 [Dissostichus mawsoni]